ncbi:BTB/POZ domain-containing protein 9-like [Adelges cooleyi]|uniref:BTB/POZ domain-containing protein 9-like n=1 Tax=Adelges cooleyi TaxID=133065 RepID=UPI00217FF689|nr:BTB/POZ domain-containing protein 9-like [Adelges cooleyi]XP_050429725.1 BTB/POZ domain-containing protein 9-like [Adelges cooleyi]
MSFEEQYQARESQLVRSDIISAAMQLRTNTWPQDKPQFRGQLKHDTHILFEAHSSPLPDLSLIHQFRGFTVRNNDSGTNLIRLVTPSIVNFIELSLWDKHCVDREKRYSYYVEVSNDGQDWVRVVDHSNYNCQGYQQLWIHPQVVRYIHIVGTNRSANETFKIWLLINDTINKVEINESTNRRINGLFGNEIR